MLVFTKREQSSKKIVEKHLPVTEKVIKILNKINEWEVRKHFTLLEIPGCSWDVLKRPWLVVIHMYKGVAIFFILIIFWFFTCYPWPLCILESKMTIFNQFSSLQSLSHVQLLATPRTAARQPGFPFTISQSLCKLMSIELVMSSNHLILCHSFLFLPSIFLLLCLVLSGFF